MKKSTKVTVEQFATLVTENEWLTWQECPAWKPSRPVVKVKQLYSKKCRCFDKMDLQKPRSEEGRVFFALFELPKGKKYKKGEGVPFYRTFGMLSLNEADATLLRVRYGGVNCSVDALGQSALTGLLNAFRRASLTDIREGGTRLLEIFGFPGDGEGVFSEDCVYSSKDVSRAEAGKEEESCRVLGYVRHAPNIPEGLLGAVCDIGVILRSIDSVDKDTVSAFAVRVGEILKSQKPFELQEAMDLMSEFSALHPLVRLDVLLFLYWKHLAGMKDGQIDFDEMKKNFDAAHALSVDELCCKAARTLGQLSGFANYSASYHSFMRTRMKV